MAISTAAATSAIDALLKWKAKQTDSQNPQLLPQDDFIYLVLTLQKIPQKGGINGVRTNPNKIPLPHPIVSPNSSELCLIIDDRPNSKLTSEIAKKKIKSDGISVTKVIKLSKLKTDYKPFEAKRKLCDSYDMFFADKRVIPFLPKLLGKQFFRKKKLPLPIELSHKNWKEQIERGCSSGLLFFRTGTCSVIRVAKVSMERDEIVENVNAAIEGVVNCVPKKWLGVRSLHLKFSDSVSLPLYQSLPDIKMKIEGIRENVEEEVMEVEEAGKKNQRKKSRIHEINHGDNTELNADDGDGDGGSDNKKKRKKSKKGKSNEEDEVVLDEGKQAKKSVKEKKRKGNVTVVEEEDDDIDNTEGSEKIAKKKGKKLDADSGKKKGRLVSSKV